MVGKTVGHFFNHWKLFFQALKIYTTDGKAVPRMSDELTAKKPKAPCENLRLSADKHLGCGSELVPISED
jgi:hypothetical protein